MKYFKKDGAIYAFDDAQLYLITSEYTELTQAEKEAHLNLVAQVILPSLKPRQFRLALLDAGILDEIEQAIDAIEDPNLKRKIQIEYQYTSDFERNNESILYMIDLLKLNQEQVDSLWIKALTF